MQACLRYENGTSLESDATSIATPLLSESDEYADPVSLKVLADDIIAGLHEDIERELVKLSAQLDPGSIRPPHDMRFFPCDFPDCIQCLLQRSSNASVLSFREELDRYRRTTSAIVY